MTSENPLFVNLPRLREALRKYNATATDIAVMEDIAQWANRYGRAFPTEKAIAARTGLRRKAVSRSVDWLAAHGFMTIKREKRGQDKHPRNNYYIVKPFRLSRPDKQSEHFKASKWRRWCEIGKKRFYNALKRKQAAQAAAGTVRDTAARMAAGKEPTPAQAREARARRGGGFAGFGDALRGMGLLGAPTAAAAPVDDYSQQVRQRGDMLQALREHEAAAAMASQPTQTAAPGIAPTPTEATQPTASAPTVSEQRERMASENRERKAQADEELQQLRESLQRQPAPAPTVSSAARMAARDIARYYRRPSYPADSSSPWPSSTEPAQPVQQAQATADMQQEAQAAWLAGLEATRRQATRSARNMASQRADYPANPWPAQPVPAVQ